MTLFPNGIWTYLVGGLLIGTAVSTLYWLTGKRVGASGVLTSAFSYLIKRPAFAKFKSERNWRTWFTFGLVAGGALYALSFGAAEPTQVSISRLAAGGFLVGLGTRASRGCTSGHGICGLSSLNRFSLVHVLTFMGVAMVTAQLTRSWFE